MAVSNMIAEIVSQSSVDKITFGESKYNETDPEGFKTTFENWNCVK